MRKLLIIILLALSLSGCRSKIDHIYSDVTSNYTVEEVNYFYECCFNEPGYTTIRKWEKDIYYHLEGDTLAEDTFVLCDLATWFNAQGFPIHMWQAENRERANLLIAFKPGEKVGSGCLDAAAHLYGKGSIIDSVEVEMPNRFYGAQRKTCFEHELLHALGVSHVSTDGQSIVFPISSLARFSAGTKEKTTLQMLYSYEWPENFSDSLFEKSFSTQLYHVNSIEKLHTYTKNANVDKQIVDTIYRYGIIQPEEKKQLPQIYKHAAKLKVFVDGDIPELALDSLQLVLQEFNRSTPNLQLEYSSDTLPLYGIHIHFIKDNTLPPNGILFKDLWNMIPTIYRFNLIYDTTITIHYNEQFSKVGHMLGHILYNTVSLKGDYGTPRKIFEENTKGLHLKPFYRQLLEVYYSPHLPHSFTKSQLEEVMQLMAADSVNATKQQ